MKKNKAEYTPTEALKCLDGVSKNAFYDDMKNGVITYDDRAWGKKTRRYIDGAELTRVYGSKFIPQRLEGTSETNETGRFATSQENIKTTHENKELEIEVRVLREQNTTSKEIINDLRVERDDWKKQAQTLLLQAPSKTDSDKSILSPVQSNELFSGTEQPKIEKGYSGVKFSAIAATILLALGLGGAGVYFWPEIETRLNGAGSSEILAEGSKTEDLNLIAPAAGEKSEGQGVTLPNYRMNFTPAPDWQSEN